MPPRDSELSRIRQVLAGLLVETNLIRLSRSLARKYSPDQPRAPAGQPDGGQWISEGSGAGEGDVDPALVGPGLWASLASQDQAGEDGRSRERTLLEDGSEVLTIRIHAGPRAGDEEHTVTAPDGESRVFETSGDMQTIRDGSSGEILSRTRFTGTGVKPVASVQPAFLPALPLVVTTTVELAAILATVLSAREGRFGAALGLSANGYAQDGSLENAPLVWVRPLTRSELEVACPRAGEVSALADRVAAQLRQSKPLLTPQNFGNALHYEIANAINSRNDPDFVAEISFDDNGKEADYGDLGSIRLDVLENTKHNTVCVYDHKTGSRGLSASRALWIATIVKKRYPHVQQIIIV
ncbi:hypothetical protein J2X36_001103 [Methylobacterium sp. BE186]|uniref:hypothetical protein n=1 Tax=Methylobacterium sp. BE186 TaxID=2817715 RepID=UPI002854C34A|nr:hypothetical protein [Methylobacterium sp. BE186]MDR7036365.1 hypothetical protein [Methylobacterium sp. BE186]